MANSFYILGTSSGGLPVADKATSGYLLKTGDSLTLIDCGGGVTQSFLKRGFNPLEIDRICISHTHSDHVCELTLFLQLIYLHKRTKPLDLYLPEEFISPFRNYLQAVYLMEEKLPFKLNFHPITNNFVLNNEGFEIKAILTDHLSGYKELIEKLDLPNKMQSFSFLINTGQKTLLYSSDLATITPIDNYLHNLDYLIIETTHIKIEDVHAAAQGKSINQIIATHLGKNDEIRQYVERANQLGLQNLIVAMDGMEIPL